MGAYATLYVRTQARKTKVVVGACTSTHGRTSVEAEPSDPEHGSADECQELGEITAVLLIYRLAGLEDKGANEAGNTYRVHRCLLISLDCVAIARVSRHSHTQQETSNDVDDVAACEVADAPHRQVAYIWFIFKYHYLDNHFCQNNNYYYDTADRPNPMRDKAVHQKVPKKEEDEQRIELHAICERDRGDASAVAEGKRARGMVFRR